MAFRLNLEINRLLPTFINVIISQVCVNFFLKTSFFKQVTLLYIFNWPYVVGRKMSYDNIPFLKFDKKRSIYTFNRHNSNSKQHYSSLEERRR